MISAQVACAAVADATSKTTQYAPVDPTHDDGDVSAPCHSPARCALVFGANTTVSLAVAVSLQAVLAAQAAPARAYFYVAAAVQLAFAFAFFVSLALRRATVGQLPRAWGHTVSTKSGHSEAVSGTS